MPGAGAAWSFGIRPLAAADLDFARTMLLEAAFWRPDRRRPPAAEGLADPRIIRYLPRCGRRGDRGVVATVDGQPVGAAWYRLFDRSEPGYGFVDEQTPELTVAVDHGWRGRGVGRALLAALLAQAGLEGVAAVSLSVGIDNPAERLYRSLGFREVARAGGSKTMVAAVTGADRPE